MNLRSILLSLLLLIGSSYLYAQSSGKYVRSNSESQMVFRIYSCLANEDPYCYISLFPDLDTLTKIVMKAAPPNSKDYREMASLRRQPALMFYYDSVYRAKLRASFEQIVALGKSQGLHWQKIIPVRYELVKARKTTDTVYEMLAPTRFTGYFVIQDGISRKQYIFEVAEMLQLQGEWFGGYLGQIFKAETIDDFESMKVEAVRNKKNPPSVIVEDSAKAIQVTANIDDDDDGANPLGPQKMIVERKLYIGKFDNEIPVQLYIRSLKGGCPEVICQWEAMYRFGDQDDFVLLSVSKNKDGKWHFEEIPDGGTIELELADGVFTGSWLASDGQTGYEVRLKETPASTGKIEKLDGAILDLKSFGKK